MDLQCSANPSIMSIQTGKIKGVNFVSETEFTPYPIPLIAADLQPSHRIFQRNNHIRNHLYLHAAAICG